MNNVFLMRFSSKIKLVDKNTFNKTVKGYPKITEYEDDNIIKSDKAFTDGIIMCNSGGIYNKKGILLFHFFPNSREDNERLIKKLKNRYNPQKQDKNSCRGLIIGGDSFYPMSIDLKNKIIALFNRLKIPFSVIWGRNTNTLSSVAYSANTDTWLVNVHPNTWLVNVHPNEKENRSVLSLKKLKETFKEIKIDQGDKLIEQGS